MRSGFPTRTLRMVCQEHLGMGPKRYPGAAPLASRAPRAVKGSARYEIGDRHRNALRLLAARAFCGRVPGAIWRVSVRHTPSAARFAILKHLFKIATEWLFASFISVLVAATAGPAAAQKKYDPGASDTEIKVGNIGPYSGPVSAYSVINKTEAAYFNKLNSEGGINDRKIKFISYDDGFSPPK